MNRCLNCHTEARPQDDDCRKCGDRVKPRPRITMAVERLKRPEITLTPEQEAALAKVKDWLEKGGDEPFRLFGPAGTGKTTLAKRVQSFGNVVYGAYTGKAASVLRRKGVPATTIHSAIYRPTVNHEARARHRELVDEAAELKVNPNVRHDVELAERLTTLIGLIDEAESEMRRPGFELSEDSDWSYADLIVLDEVSMVNEKIAMDIESFGVPVLVLGDPAQLPPVEGGGYYTREKPDVLLTEVHRQALESPVLKLATEIRLGRGWTAEKVSLEKAMAADQIIVWKNATRWNLTMKIRQKQGKPQGIPVVGDRITCLTNNKELGILNGQQYLIHDLEGEDGAWRLLLEEIDGAFPGKRWIKAFKEGFIDLAHEIQMKRDFMAHRGLTGAFTFANVITCHRAQGSEWPVVYVVDQTDQMRSDQRAWAYTAVTRASESVTIASTRA